jgi:hypothetical protein
MERAMGIEQIRMNQTKALPPASQFNWSQMESNPHVSGNRVDQEFEQELHGILVSHFNRPQ